MPFRGDKSPIQPRELKNAEAKHHNRKRDGLCDKI